MDNPVWTFWLPSALMGLGIAIDVAIATIARFRDPTMTFRSWTVPVAIAHIVLPAVGYYSWWGLGQISSLLILPLGLIAFILVAVFIHEAYCEWIDSEPKITWEPLVEPFISTLTAGERGRLIMVLAVSMDALWSGPAKAAQAASGGWNWLEVMFSFFVAGLVVALVAQGSLAIANRLRKIKFDRETLLSVYLVIGKFGEAVILLGFGVLSLWNAFSPWIGLGSLWISIFISSVLLLPFWMLHSRRLFDVQQDELNADSRP